jgi:2-polyprenyl-6-methoxyphenol hydroxylase-like FAD-dependent oxidoreductase
MRLRRVAVLGGGPGGLYAARLLKLALPSCEITVHEQQAPHTTFGFGVGLTEETRRRLAAADPDTLHDLVEAGHRYGMTMQVDGSVARVAGSCLMAIARTNLLTVLQRHAEKAGVRLEFGAHRTADELDADVVVAAVGVGSATRAAGSFGAHTDTGRGLYLWCGTDFALADAIFAPARTEHGIFVVHAYPYAPDRSTFLVETDEDTWRRAGFATSTAATPSDASDEKSLRDLAEVFTEHLDGHPLIGNRTRWSRFRTVHCARWSDGRTVLLGDAAHTAHYSIGSGTKLAMEDAIGLVDALHDAPDRTSVFAWYEAVRRPAVERLQELACRSQLWWDSFPSRLHLPVERLMVAYMSRAGNVPLTRFAATDPDVVAAALEQYAGGPAPSDPAGITAWVLGRQTRATTRNLVTVDDVLTDPWGDAGDAVLARAHRALEDGAAGFRLTGPAERHAVLTRLDLAERIRTETGSFVVVEGPADLRDDLATGLVSGRADLVEFAGEES